MDFAALEMTLASLGLRDLRRIVGGWQSLAVYDARVDGQHVAVKVFDPELVDRGVLGVRLEALSLLAATTDLVCAPVRAGGHLVNEIAVEGAGSAYAVAYEFAEGDAPDITNPEHVARMGRSLADLHSSMAALPPLDLPPLRAFPAPSDLAEVADRLGLPTAWLSRASSDGPRQLLHGDFSSKNVRVASGRWRVFDLDDCGHGPIELDVANSLYFVLFDALTGSDPETYRHFRHNFLGGYQDQAQVAPPDDVLDGLITRRVLALASWLADPTTAPPGILTASAEWHTTLRGFVRRFLETADGTMPAETP